MYTLLAIVDNKVVETTTWHTKEWLDLYKQHNNYDLTGVGGYWASFGSPTIKLGETS